MAGDWIKMRAGLLDDPRVVRLAEILGEPDPDLIIGKLFRLWVYADRHTTDGLMSTSTMRTVNNLLGYPGFAEALERVGWLRPTPSGVVIPRFAEHNGASAKRRAGDSRRQENWRNRQSERDNSVTDTVTGPLPREEKRREDIEAASAASSPGKPAAEKPARKRAATPRKRDDLFDAVAEVTHSDPKSSGSHVGKVCAALKAAEPPYTPAEVRALPGILSARGFELPLSLGTVEKYIGWTRKAPAPAARGGRQAGLDEFVRRGGGAKEGRRDP